MSDRLQLRAARMADGPAVARIYAPIVRDTVISFEDTPPTAQNMSARIEQTLETHPWLLAETDAGVVGYAYAAPHRARTAYKWSCDVSVYVAETARRAGAARTLYAGLFSILVDLGYANAFAGITLPNEASIGLHEHMGFRLVGVYPSVGFKMGAWRDVGWWSRPLQALGDDPAAPRPFRAGAPA